MTHHARTVALVGGGTMGGDIAASFAAGGWIAHVVEPQEAARSTLPSRFAAAMKALAAPAGTAPLQVHAGLETLPWPDVDLVIEAVPERLELKREVFAALERQAPPDIPLCSNSSAIPIGRIAEGLSTRHRMVGTHYFMPGHLVPAVEVVCSKDTDVAYADRVADMLKSVGKVPVRVGLDIPGFVANRMQAALSREAIDLVARGIATPEDIDNAVRYGFGFRYIAAGPLLMRDHSGIDVHCAAAATIYPDLCNSAEPSPYMVDKVAQGHVGMKAKHGFYDWTDASIAKEKARFEQALLGAMDILRKERES